LPDVRVLDDGGDVVEDECASEAAGECEKGGQNQQRENEP
jgi:hypothetical protein